MAWISACILAVLPTVVAADFGGVLWWTQYATACAILVAAVLALPSLFSSDNVALLRNQYVVVILLVWWAFAWLQTVPMFGGLVGILSDGSKVAYRDWMAPFVGEGGTPAFFPISIAPEQSSHAVSVLALIVCACWTANQVFISRPRISMLLNALAIGAALHASFGIVRQVYPEIHVFGVEMQSNAFGCFVNRNNAALFMNIGLAASLGLLTWRLAALTGMEVDEKDFELNDLLSLMNDRDSIIGVLTASLCVGGLLVCGSRGGVAAFVVGCLLAFGWVRQKRGIKTVPVVVTVVLICAAVLLIPLNLNLQSIQRFEIFSGEATSTLLSDGRLPHWETSIRTAKAYFPGGSGLGSYAYAYLPYQVTGSDKWFHHADNLWLELVVEQGLIGLMLAITIFFLLIRALLRMVNSVDPIDHGLRVSGWFMVGAVLVSQLFDFGLIIPSTLLAVAVFVSASLARAAAAGLNRGRDEKEVFPSKYGTLWSIGLAGLVILLAFLSTIRLHSDAKVEAVVKHVSATLPAVEKNSDELAKLASQIRSAPRSDWSPLLLNELSKVEHALARLTDTAAALPQNASEANLAYQRTDITARRKEWHARSDDSVGNIVSEQANELYQSTLNSSSQSLRGLPLGMEARTWQLYLDFVHQDRNRSEQAIAQLAQIFKGNAKMLELIGSHAAVSGDVERAASLWRNSLELSPDQALEVLDLVQAQDDIALLDVLPADKTVFRIIARQLVDRKKASRELLERASKEIHCDDCETKKEKADCHQLAGDIAYQLHDLDLSFDQYRTAIELTPIRSKLHLTYIQRFRENDRKYDALVAARRARILFPKDNRFDRIIKEMAAEELRDLEEVSDESLLRQSTDTP